MRRATVSLRAGSSIGAYAIAAGHNAVARNLCDDQGVRTTVLIVDDHDDFRESASALLEAEGFAVVGAAADGAEAIAAVERLRPQVVLLDIQLPDLDGFAVAERLAMGPDPPSVVLVSSRKQPPTGPDLRRRPRWDSSRSANSGSALASLAEPADALVPAPPLAGRALPSASLPNGSSSAWTTHATGCQTSSPAGRSSPAGWSRGHGAQSRSGALMAATGFAWFLGNFAAAGVEPVGWLGAHALYLYRGPLVHLLVTYPRGRLTSYLDRVSVGIGYAAAVATPVWRSEIATIVLAALLVAVCARLYVRAVGPSRRARLLALWAAG